VGEKEVQDTLEGKETGSRGRDGGERQPSWMPEGCFQSPGGGDRGSILLIGFIGTRVNSERGEGKQIGEKKGQGKIIQYFSMSPSQNLFPLR